MVLSKIILTLLLRKNININWRKTFKLLIMNHKVVSKDEAAHIYIEFSLAYKFEFNSNNSHALQVKNLPHDSWLNALFDETKS